MTRAMYFTANKIIRKGDDIYHSASKLEHLLRILPFRVYVQLAEAPSGVITAEVKADAPFDPLEVERILFPKKRRDQIPMYH